jgi:hypothetical protein
VRGNPRLAVIFASATIGPGVFALALSCSHGDYDGSYQGGFDGGAGEGGTVAIERVVQPGTGESLATANNVFEVTIAAGTFTSPATVTISTRAERTLDNGLIVPVFEVRATQDPKKPIQIVFHGAGQQGGGSPSNDRSPMPAIQSGTTFSPLPMVGSSNGNQTGSYWGLSKTFGTFSLALVTGVTAGAFVDTPSTCTAACCGSKGATTSGFKGGCYCGSAPDHACFLEHCPDLDLAAERCTGIAVSTAFGDLTCKAFGAQCPGSGCGDYPNNGFCTTGSAGMGMGSSPQPCCVTPGKHGKCVNSPQLCAGFAARCTTANHCPTGTSCCVFDNESYCAKDCPPDKRACNDNAECADAGADGGSCQGGGCPVGVCGTLPAGCR